MVMKDLNTNKLKHVLVGYINIITLFFVTFGHLDSRKIKLMRLGSSYGGWWVPKELSMQAYVNPYLVSIGLGHDVSFDFECLKLGMNLVGLDPLSSSIRYAEKELGSFPNKTLIQSGIWITCGYVKFFQPRNIGHDSWSITNSQLTDTLGARSFKVMTLDDIVKKVPLIANSDFIILKIDIEGAEYEILKNQDFTVLKANFLAVEFDYLSLIKFKSFGKRIVRAWKVRRLLVKLKKIDGFQLIKIENFNFFLIKM